MGWGLRLGLLLGIALVPRIALAGAWTIPQGRGVVITTVTASSAGKAYDADGKPQPTPRYSKNELQVLMEYGVTDWLTAIVSPSLQHVDIAAPTDARRSGVGITEFGARARLFENRDTVFSTQATLRTPGTRDVGNPAAAGYTGAEADLRMLFGLTFAAGPVPAFLDIQVAQRFRNEGPPNEARVDVTLGLRPAPRWLVLVQQFNVMSEGSGSPAFPANHYHKLQFSVVHELTPHWAVQAGGFTTFAGANALQENGAIAGLWYRF